MGLYFNAMMFALERQSVQNFGKLGSALYFAEVKANIQYADR